MARRPELFIRGLSDGEAAHLLKLARRSRSPVTQHRAMLLFASFQGQSVSQIALSPRVERCVRRPEVGAVQGAFGDVRQPVGPAH